MDSDLIEHAFVEAVQLKKQPHSSGSDMPDTETESQHSNSNGGLSKESISIVYGLFCPRTLLSLEEEVLLIE